MKFGPRHRSERVDGASAFEVDRRGEVHGNAWREEGGGSIEGLLLGSKPVTQSQAC
ncbi:MAG: hypothetical protein JWR48_7612 [Mycobacterium sp.]|nr:hypothetical protein [Mycobacterium sp.]